MRLSHQEFDEAQSILSTLTTFHDEEDVRQLARAIREQRRLSASEALRKVADHFATDPGLVDAENWVRERATRIARRP